jgi:flagellar hook-associated protein 2
VASLGIDGLVSGIDTTTLINQLMQVEAAPQTLLKSKQASTQNFVSALQALNTKVASLGESAAKVAKADSWQAWKATSSSTTTTATASGKAQAGSVTFTVDKVATTQVTLSEPVVTGEDLIRSVPPVVTVRKHDGTMVAIEPATGSLADVTKAINEAAEAGISATAVRVGDNAYRLQFTATKTGTEGSFEIYEGTHEQVELGTATRLDAATVRTAEDAQVTLWKGTAYERSITQSSNTFADLMTGVDVTVTKATGAGEEPVTITVTQDVDALKKLASGLVGAIGVVFSEITSRSAVTTSTNSDGTTKTSGGLFTGDSAVRSLQQQITEAASYPVDGVSPSTVGIVLGKDGTFTFDEAKFAEAFAKDPAKVQAIVSGLAERVATVATNASDKYEGSLTLKIQGQEKLVKDMGTQIEDWDRRLQLRRESLQRTYSALEVTLSNLQSQSTWLAGQLASLSAGTSS